jgi:hypothetical protein
MTGAGQAGIGWAGTGPDHTVFSLFWVDIDML